MSDPLSLGLAKAKRLHASGRLREAEAAFSALLKTHGLDADAVCKMADAAWEMGEAEAARALYAKAVRLLPGSAEILGRMGILLARMGKRDEAIDALRKATVLAPTDARLFYNLGRTLADADLTGQAADAYRKATLLDPSFAWAFTNLGNALADLGLHDDAAKAYRRALDIDPANAGCWSNFLLSSQYAQGVTAAKLFELSQGFESHVGKPLAKSAKPQAGRCDPNQPLRIGYVSPDFNRHPVGYFMQGVFAHHDRDAFKIFAYSCHPKEDDLSASLRQGTDAWIGAHQLDDQALARRIRSDRIDILVDLAGHTGNNRLTVFARKPAPLQVAWCGYVGTTGLTAMDAIIADRFHIPPEEEAFYVERVLRMPHSWLCCPPPSAAPPVSPPPSADGKPFTFGCFNNPAKISPGAIRLWQRLLNAAPGSRLVLRAGFFTSDERIEIYRQRFQNEGADPSRIDFLPPLPRAELLKAYGDIDVALDPFPYSGGITTLEALWMGVPVVTKTGASFPGRHSTSFLSTAGLSELVASDEDEYLDIAKGLANSPERLRDLRLGMRSRLEASPLLDPRGFTRDYEKLLRDAWGARCDANRKGTAR